MTAGTFTGSDLFKHEYLKNVLTDIRNNKKISFVKKGEVKPDNILFTPLLKKLFNYIEKSDTESILHEIKQNRFFLHIFEGKNGVYKWTDIYKLPYSIGVETVTPADWEKIICVAYNLISCNCSIEKAVDYANIDSWGEKHSKKIKTGLSIVYESFKDTYGTMKHFGGDIVRLSDEWNKIFFDTTGKSTFTGTKTSKTDMITDNYNISLKKEGQSRLMSGHVGESTATVLTAFNNMKKGKSNKFNASVFKYLADIKENFTKINSTKGIREIKKYIADGCDSSLCKEVQKQVLIHREMTAQVRELTNNKYFKKELLRESMTGGVKFNHNSASADYVLLFNTFGKGALHKINDDLLDHYINNTSINVSFKTGMNICRFSVMTIKSNISI